jgi:hypothetical protein
MVGEVGLVPFLRIEGRNQAMIRPLLGIIAAILASSCTTNGQREREFQSLEAQARSMCEIMAEPIRYVGQKVMVRGSFWQSPHQRTLFDSDCPEKELPVSLAAYVKGTTPAQKTRVIYSGIFTRQSVPPGAILAGCCEYWLRDSDLLATSPLSRSRQ